MRHARVSGLSDGGMDQGSAAAAEISASRALHITTCSREPVTVLSVSHMVLALMSFSFRVVHQGSWCLEFNPSGKVYSVASHSILGWIKPSGGVGLSCKGTIDYGWIYLGA